MKQSALVVLAAFLVTSGTAAMLPDNTISGALYVSHADNNDTELVAFPGDDDAAESGRLQTRTTTEPRVTKTVCGDAFPHYVDVESAIMSFEHMLSGGDRELKARDKFFSPSGDANIFICNYGKDITITKEMLNMLIDNAQRGCNGDREEMRYVCKCGSCRQDPSCA